MENGCKDIVQKPTTAQVKEETAHSLRVREVGAPTTLRTLVRSPQRRMMVVHVDWFLIREPLRMRGLKDEAAGAVEE
jgi:hypothetical protein